MTFEISQAKVCVCSTCHDSGSEHLRMLTEKSDDSKQAGKPHLVDFVMSQLSFLT